MLDSQAGQVEGLFSLPEMLFFHYQVVTTMELSVMSSPAHVCIFLWVSVYNVCFFI